MLDRLNKHLKILGVILSQNGTLNKMRDCDNELLDGIIKTLETLSKKSYDKLDIEKFNRQKEYANFLKNNDDWISYDIFGTDDKKQVHEVYNKAASPEIWCKFYYYIIKHLGFNSCLEIGTNLGVSGGYILDALSLNDSYHFTTMEGVDKMCQLARNHYKSFIPESQFEVHQGLYENVFEKAIDNDREYDLAFIDGNHKKEPTLDYFEKLKPKLKDQAIVIFDDINWTRGMQEAWYKLRTDNIVNYSIDFYKLGLVVIDRNEKKRRQAFSLHLSY